MKCLLCVMAIFLSSVCYGSKRGLVIILGETRAHELTYENIEKNLIKTLGADLALCIGVHENYDYDNPFYRNAKYKFTYPEPLTSADFDLACESILNNHPALQKPLFTQEFLKIKDQYLLGGVPGVAGLLIFYRWFLLKNLIDHDLLDKYDFFIITRSDYIYQLPHPRLELFSKDSIYIPDGEHYGGVTDRHVVLPRKFVVSYLNMLNEMVLKGTEYYKKIGIPENIEQFIKLHLIQQDVFKFVKFFPYVMYAVRPVGGRTSWSLGVYSEKHGYFIKYDSEYEESSQHKADFEKERSSIDKFYKRRIP